MQTNQYQALAMRTAKMFPTLQANLDHAALGIGSETGELAETIAGNWMELSDSQGVVNIGEECGDGCWYAALMSDTMNWKFEDLLITDPAVVREMSFGLHKAAQTFSPAALQLMLTAFSGVAGNDRSGRLTPTNISAITRSLKPAAHDSDGRTR